MECCFGMYAHDIYCLGYLQKSGKQTHINMNANIV